MSATRFVALGDSITVGLGDPMPDGTWRGWAALLAECLGDVEFYNIAEPGALAYTLVDCQLPTALALRPHIAAVVVGANDTLRGSFDLTRTGRALNHAVARLRASGAIVLTARVPDPARLLRLPASLARPLSRRIRAVNAVADAVALAHDTVHMDGEGHPNAYERRMWSVDRFHPSERGHRLFATAYAELLVRRGVAVHHFPDLEPVNPAPSAAASAWWMATKGVKWIYDRSTDLVPNLVAMAATEWWHNVRGTARRIDQRVGIEVDRAIAMLHQHAPLPHSYPYPVEQPGLEQLSQS